MTASAINNKLSRPAQKKPAADDAFSFDSTWLSRLSAILSYICVALLLLLGWHYRSEAHLTAEEGLGYALGIVGGSMMLLLLLYPLRKKARFMRSFGRIKHWFRLHMIFGVVGPVLVLFHANFGLGSLNSNVALFCMLLVAGSGLVGRYVYMKIHYGLYGQAASLKRLHTDLDTTRERLLNSATLAPDVLKRLAAYEKVALAPPRGVLHSTGRLLLIAPRTYWTQSALLRMARRDLQRGMQNGHWNRRLQRRLYKALKQQITTHLSGVRKVVEFSFYERLFSLWHVLHYPLFLMLVIAGIVHVFAVHIY